MNIRSGFIVGILAITSLLSCAHKQEAAFFSKEYQHKNKNTSEVLVPEVRELINIIFAITPNAMLKEPLTLYKIFDEGEEYRKYYSEVLDHFLPFSDHPIVSKFNEMVGSSKTIWNYPSFNINSYTFQFQGQQITPTGVHNSFWGQNPLVEYVEQLEDFAKKSGFRKFYADHQNFYKKIVKTFVKLSPTSAQKKWLEERFPERIDSYKIFISPLVYAFHCTGGNASNGFTEVVMSVSAPHQSRLAAGEILQRTIFTEIDHNYVNPISAKYRTEIDKAFAPLDYWAKEGHGYGTEWKVFNEYMTWAVFLLYIHDTKPEALKSAEKVTVQKMVKRKFYRFNDFYSQLLELYKRKKDKNISMLYPQMIKWAEEKNRRQGKGQG